MTAALDVEVSEAALWLEAEFDKQHVEYRRGEWGPDHHVRFIVAELDDYRAMDMMYEANGSYFSSRAAVWSAEEGLYIEEGASFYKKNWMA